MSRLPGKLTAIVPWLLSILTGLLYAVCFAPFNQSWLCWIALTPVTMAVWFFGENSKRRWLRNALIGYVAGIVFFTCAFSWLGALGTLFENFWLRGLSLLLSIYLALYFAFWSWFIGLIKPRNFLSSGQNLLAALLAASAWVAQEWIRGWLFTGFGWNGIGIALHDNWALIQVAEFTGAIGLSFVVVFTNIILVATPVRLFLEARTHRMLPHFDLTLTLAGIVGLLTFGLYRVQNPSPTRPLHVSAIEANVPQEQKFDPQFVAQIFDRFQRLTEIAVHSSPPPNLLVWPESAMPEPVTFLGTASYRFVSELSAATGTDLLLGTLDVQDRHDYNAAALISGATQQIQIYRKVHLVPFGEYIPLRRSFPLFAAVAGRWVPGDFDVGTKHTVFHLSKSNIGVAPLICFEDTIGDLTRRFVLNGADLLANVTNDAWFLRSAGSRQHLQNAIFRCVETRRPMVRAANTGVTCFVNQFGRVTQILQDETGNTFAEGVLNGTVNVPTSHTLTFYVRHGEVFAEVCTGVSLIAIMVLLWRASARRRPGSSPR